VITDPQLGKLPGVTRILLIGWGIIGGSGTIWLAFRFERVHSTVVAVLVLLVIMPVLALSYYAYHVYLRTVERARKHAVEMGELFNSTLSTLALAIDAKDKHRHGHTQRVQKYARAMAEALHLENEHIVGIAAAALLHDIGKLAIPEYILNKRGSLSRDEMRKMQMHPQLGADIISKIRFPFPVAEAILSHHERFDGEGYPNGRSAKDIPLASRVLAVADAFDAYLSDRIESKQTLESAIQFLRDGAGAAFDPEIVAVWEPICSDLVVWPSSSALGAHTGIQQATSELKILESLSQSIEGLTSVHEILFAVRAHVTKSVRGCTATIERGERQGIPVVFAGKVIATICVDRPGFPLDEDELRMVNAVAAKVAPALNNAMAIEAARREATVDKLTGLTNRRAFEMMSASLDRQHYSIVLIDLNSFKAVNDNFGHTSGDATLIRVATHLRVAFQDAQLTCRLGGDEFLVLTFASARILRTQIRRFRQMVAWDPAHEPYRKLRFGASCGVASIPVDAKTIEQAMQHADERMYAIKTRYKQFAGHRSDAGVTTGAPTEVTSRRESIQSPSVSRR
jgi:diguanylate cyclase (GGDEF)-like protein/putative nucleotidyltransferase with HDIG domain